MLDKQGYTRARTCTWHHAWASTHTHTHTQKHVILFAFPLQQWLRERASVLRYTYITCLVRYFFREIIAIYSEIRTKHKYRVGKM